MNHILHGYAVNDATWMYLSVLLVVAVFFRFNRLWSLRNFDLLLLLSASPGVFFVKNGLETLGSIWLFVCTGLFLLRLFLDPWFRRRPLLEQNLNAGGLIFLCVAAFAFQVTNVMTESPDETTVTTVRHAEDLLQRKDTSDVPDSPSSEPRVGPAGTLITATTAVASSRLVAEPGAVEFFAARLMACLSHLAVVLGMILLGKRHLGDVRLGVAIATLYLLLPCTAYQVGRVDQVLPAALVLWACNYYHRPMVAGALLGLASGTVFFPAFLLPLWAMFYGRNGSVRFGAALAGVAAVLMTTVALTASNGESFLNQTIGSIDWSILQFSHGQTAGFWASIQPVYRLPVMAAFVVMLVLLCIFPRQKNIEHLMAHSAAIIVGTQLWYPQHGGVYVLWYLPLMLAVTFRPRLTHLVPPESAPLLRIARSVQSENRPERTFSTVGRQHLR